jgi:SAM-dependent methyltransferase
MVRGATHKFVTRTMSLLSGGRPRRPRYWTAIPKDGARFGFAQVPAYVLAGTARFDRFAIASGRANLERVMDVLDIRYLLSSGSCGRTAAGIGDGSRRASYNQCAMDLRECCATAGARHPWEVSRACFFRDRLVAQGILRPGTRVVDVGAGDGYLASVLVPVVRPGGAVLCYDAHYRPDLLEELRTEAEPELTFTSQRPDRGFDLVLLLDVLEHVADDRDFLAGVVRDLVRPGGALLAGVPAWPEFFTRHDQTLGHHRRYRPARLQQLLRQCDLTVVDQGGLFHSLLAVRGAEKLGELMRSVHSQPNPESAPSIADTAVAHWRGHPWLTQAALKGLALDSAVGQMCARAGVVLPGLSTWAIARKA